MEDSHSAIFKLVMFQGLNYIIASLKRKRKEKCISIPVDCLVKLELKYRL